MFVAVYFNKDGTRYVNLSVRKWIIGATAIFGPITGSIGKYPRSKSELPDKLKIFLQKN